jgi:hypothetical protein
VPAPSVEAIWQDFQGDQFQTLGLDIWNGNPTQLTLFQHVTEVSFPLLLRAASVGLRYRSSIDILGIIDQQGRVLWQGHVSQTDHVRKMLTELLTPSAPVIQINLSVIDFGTIQVGSQADRTLTLSNAGNEDLLITGIVFSSSALRIRETSFVIAPGETRTLTLTLAPENEASPGRLQIFSNDPKSPRLTVSVAARIRSAEPPNPAADFDRSGKVDISDFLGLSQAFGSASETFDIDRSGRVDFVDFLIFSNAFGQEIQQTGAP